MPTTDNVYAIDGTIQMTNGERVRYWGAAIESREHVYEYRDYAPSSYAPNGGRMWYIDQHASVFDEMPKTPTLGRLIAYQTTQKG